MKKKSFAMFRVLLVFLLAVMLVPQVTFASTVNDYDISDNTDVISGYTEYDEEDIGEVLTFDEMVNELVEDEGMTVKEAQSLLESNYVPTTRNANVRAATYRNLSSSFTVTSSYKPTLEFRCQTSEGGGSFRGIVKILNVGMNRSYNGISKTFDGTVYTQLVDANRIYWIVNGDFYNNGTVSVNGSVSIGIGGYATINFGLSYNTSHYAYCYKTGNRNF